MITIFCVSVCTLLDLFVNIRDICKPDKEV